MNKTWCERHSINTSIFYSKYNNIDKQTQTSDNPWIQNGTHNKIIKMIPEPNLLQGLC